MSSAVIYTDLDGTLLDHHTYAFDEDLKQAVRQRVCEGSRKTPYPPEPTKEP